MQIQYKPLIRTHPATRPYGISLLCIGGKGRENEKGCERKNCNRSVLRHRQAPSPITGIIATRSHPKGFLSDQKCSTFLGLINNGGFQNEKLEYSYKI